MNLKFYYFNRNLKLRSSKLGTQLNLFYICKSNMGNNIKGAGLIFHEASSVN